MPAAAEFSAENSTDQAPGACRFITEETACGAKLDTTGYPLWCRKCRATNKRQYEATKKQMQETRGYAAGVSSTKDYFIRKFTQQGANQFTGYEVAALLNQSKFPSVD